MPNEEYYSIISFKGGTNNGCVTKETSHLYRKANFEFVNKRNHVRNMFFLLAKYVSNSVMVLIGQNSMRFERSQLLYYITADINTKIKF